MLNPISTRAAWISFGLIFWLLAASAFAQVTPETAEETTPAWQPPDITSLSSDWWQQFDSPSPDTFKERMEQFVTLATTAVGGLSGADLVTGQNLMNDLRGQFKLLLVARQATEPQSFEPIPTQDSYSLDELLALREQWRSLEKRQKIPQMRLDELKSQADLLQRRRDSLVRQYNATDANAPARVLLGLQRMTTRLEYELTVKQSANLETRLEAIQSQYEALNEHLQYAREHLAVGDFDKDAFNQKLAAARDDVTRLTEQQSDVQRQLLDVLSSDSVKPSLEILRKQQTTRASAELSLAKLHQLKLQAEETWYRLRQGNLDYDFDIQQSVEDAAAFVKETSRQIEVWTAASQTTILTPTPAQDLNSKANIDLAHATAQETLGFVDQIRGVIDDLQLLGEVLTADQVGMQQGLKSVWTRFKIAAGDLRYLVAGYLDITLFHIGDAPVTIGRILTMVVILALGFALSWFLRHMLDRLNDRRQFAKSPAVYTLGRLMHYLIIMVAVFAAFGSIGLDFRNFALIAGALSVGIGFGLQSIVNNFVSGLILLFEGSLRVGDYIELETGLRGIVKEINTRATVINTNDSIDVVVPNSNFVTNQLTNWTLREPLARFRIEFGVAYGSDKERVKEAALAAASKVEFVVQHMPSRKPEVWLVNFGESALIFELLCWVSKAGVRRPQRVHATILWELETQLREHGLHIPFPQRDLHLRTGFDPLQGTVKSRMEPDERTHPSGRTDEKADNAAGEEPAEKAGEAPADGAPQSGA